MVSISRIAWRGTIWRLPVRFWVEERDDTELAEDHVGQIEAGDAASGCASFCWPSVVDPDANLVAFKPPWVVKNGVNR